jgi:hypothetical protein
VKSDWDQGCLAFEILLFLHRVYEIWAIYHFVESVASVLSFPAAPSCVKLSPMGSKDKGKKEVKKAPKPKPKPEPGRKREGFVPAPPK